MWIIPIILAMFFSGIIIDTGLTSIYAYFDWSFGPTFTVIGGMIGLIKGLHDERWYLPAICVFAFAGYIMAIHWMIDGIIFSSIIAAIYCFIENKFT